MTGSSDAFTELDLDIVPGFWRELLGVGSWLGEDVCVAMMRQYVDSIRMLDAESLANYRGRGVLYVANHQVAVESILFGVATSAYIDLATCVLAKQEHRGSWIGRMFATTFARSDLRTQPNLFALVDRDDQRVMVKTLAREFKRVATGKQGFLVHTDGTRSLRCREPVRVVSGALLDRAAKQGVPVVPVRFAGGLPVETLDERIEFPYRHGRQTIWLGAPILPDQLLELASSDRKQYVLDSLASLGGSWDDEEPHPGDPEFAAVVDAWKTDHGVTEPQAVMACCLAKLDEPSEDAQLLLGLFEGRPLPADHPRHEWLSVCARDVLGFKP